MKPNQIQSLIFSLYSADFVWGIGGAHKEGSEFKKLSIFGFEKLKKICISQVRFFDYTIIFRSTKMLAQIAGLHLCALLSLCPYVLEPLCPCALLSASCVGFCSQLMHHWSTEEFFQESSDQLQHRSWVGPPQLRPKSTWFLVLGSSKSKDFCQQTSNASWC